jgi:hypothetical protein
VPDYSFRHSPTVQGANPLWDNPPDSPVVTGLSDDKREVLCTTILDAQPEHRYSVAPDSIWPLLTALALSGLWVGGMFHPVGVPLACIPLFLVLFGWFWVSGDHKVKWAKKKKKE